MQRRGCGAWMNTGSLPSSISERLESTMEWLAEDAAESVGSDREEASYSNFQNAICRFITAIISGGDVAVRNLTAASLAAKYPLAADCEADITDLTGELPLLPSCWCSTVIISPGGYPLVRSFTR